MKRVLAFLLIAAIFAAFAPCALAFSQKSETCADYLYCVGLFNGKGTDEFGNPIYDLDGSLTRQEAMVMILRLMGLESAAESKIWKHPFTDVDDWASSFVGYAYQKGITFGMGADFYGAEETATCDQYVTFLLRALGYSDTEGDFSWEAPFELSDALGITKADTNKTGEFTRGDAAILSDNCLHRVKKDTRQTLHRDLVCRGAIKPYEVIRLPIDRISIPVGGTARLRVVQSDKRSDVSLYAAWDDEGVLEAKFTGEWVANVRTEMLITGRKKGSTKLTVTYEKGGNDKANATMYVTVR